ncbi:hypothetical protein VFPBJ_04379 [Purpureocillium lilacinum]|uniref:Uncharacterized protein n=1 Tax=Purpureocillium lilacinum TaxID=33203 RepID=A0A179GV13_PURLI|nr:hypothetical protein VFPBJ_04379 [Purpureocillium lilacinum]
MYPRGLHILHPLTGSNSSSPPPSPPPSRHDEHASLRQASDARVSEDLEHRLTEHKKSNSSTRIGSWRRLPRDSPHSSASADGPQHTYDRRGISVARR